MALSVAITVGIAAVTNGLLAAFGLNRTSAEIWPTFAPPGHTIGLIWIALFALMGAAYRLLALNDDPIVSGTARWVLALIGLCLAYPFYTHVVGGHAIQLAGNVVTFAVAAAILVRLHARGLASIFIGVVATWVVFATGLVFALVSLNGWNV